MLSLSSTRCAEWAPLWSRNSVRSSVRPSVWPPVCMSHACFVTKLNNALGIFWYHTKAQSLWFSDTNSGRWAMPPSVWNLRSKWPTPFEKRRLWQQIWSYICSHKITVLEHASRPTGSPKSVIPVWTSNA